MTAMTGDSALGARRKATRRERPGGEHTSGHLREVFAGPRPAQHELPATAAAVTSPLDGSVPWVHRAWVAAAFFLGVISRDSLADPDAVRAALERVLHLAEADQFLLPRLTPQAPGLPERRAQHRAAPAASISQIVDLLAQASEPAATLAEPTLPCEALTRCEAGCCATCQPTCPHGRSPASFTSQPTPSRRTSGTYTKSSARATACRPSGGPVPSACSHHLPGVLSAAGS